MLKVICSFSDYKPWSGAIDTYNKIANANKLEELESYLEDLYPDGIEDMKINDILWFDGDQVLIDLGITELPDEVEYTVKDLCVDLSDPDVDDVDIEESIRDLLYDDYSEYPLQFTWSTNKDNNAVIVYNIEW